jgi:hypothetical protein
MGACVQQSRSAIFIPVAGKQVNPGQRDRASASVLFHGIPRNPSGSSKAEADVSQVAIATRQTRISILRIVDPLRGMRSRFDPESGVKGATSHLESIDLLEGILPGHLSGAARWQNQAGTVVGPTKLGGHQQDAVS